MKAYKDDVIPKPSYKGAGNKIKAAIGAKPNSKTPHVARTKGKKIMD